MVLTDKLKSYSAAKAEVLPSVEHCPQKYQNNRAEFSSANQWKWAEAEHELTRAVELNPNLGAEHRALARHLSVMGRHDQAVAEARRARELDPLSVTVNAYISYACSRAD